MTNDSPLPTAKSFQFSLRQLLIAILVFAVVLALISQWGELGVALTVFGASTLAMCYGTYRNRGWLLLVGLFGLVVGGWLCTLPTTGRHGSNSRQMQCGNHLKHIALALQNYHDECGTFPPAYIADSSGRPLHSWRVLILPFLGHSDLYARYRFDEPWDGPNNRKLAAEMPPEFACPCQPRPSGGLTETNYLAVVGPGTVWPGVKPTSMSQISDGTSNTILVVEVHDSGISWLEPRDLHVTQMPMTINPLRGQGISSRHASPNDRGRGTRAVAVFCDGHTQSLPNDLPPETLRGLLTIGGGEKLGDF
jgi:hypothetical protein